MKPRTIALALTLAAATLAPGRADAQTAPKVDAVSRADARYKEGVRLYSDKKWSEAESAFRDAWVLNPTFDVGYNLGSAEYQLGKYVEAAEYLSHALRDWPLIASTSALRETARTRLAECRAHVGALRVRVSVDGAEVTVNGRKVGTSPLADEVFVAPGPAQVSAAREGYMVASQGITVARGEAREVSVSLVSTVAPKRSVVPGAVLGGVAGAALATAIGLTVVAYNKQASVQSLSKQIGPSGSCVPRTGNFSALCATLASTSTTGDTLNRVGIGMFVGAGAAALASTLYFVWPASKPSTTSGGLHLTPLVSTTGGQVLFSGAF